MSPRLVVSGQAKLCCHLCVSTKQLGSVKQYGEFASVGGWITVDAVISSGNGAPIRAITLWKEIME